MQACTFFGHRDCPEMVAPKLRRILEELILQHGVERFYVGNQGHFDSMVCHTLQSLQQQYPQVEYAIVLAYLPETQQADSENTHTIFPEGLELVHPRFAISRRNAWMLERAEYVVTYVTHNWGCAAQYAARASKSGKTVINL